MHLIAKRNFLGNTHQVAQDMSRSLLKIHYEFLTQNAEALVGINIVSFAD